MLVSTCKSIWCYNPEHQQQECKFYMKLATVLLTSRIILIIVLNVFSFSLTLTIIIFCGINDQYHPYPLLENLLCSIFCFIWMIILSVEAIWRFILVWQVVCKSCVVPRGTKFYFVTLVAQTCSALFPPITIWYRNSMSCDTYTLNTSSKTNFKCN
jgi:hypothetical protein